MTATSTATTIHPYLFFGGRCEEAIAFYQRALGARTIMIMRYSESPEPLPPGRLAPGFEHKVMHASFGIGPAIIMASDGCDATQSFTGFSLSLTLPTEAEVNRAFDALSDGGKVIMPPSKTFWSPRFGMLTDRFGISWMLSAASA